MRSRVVIALVGAAVIASSVVIGHWWTHPTLFEDHGDGFRAAPAPVSASALSVAVTYPSKEGTDRAVTFDDARAHFAANSAAARATFSICRPRPEGGLIGAVRGLGPFCSTVRPLAPGARMTYTPSEDGDYVVMTLQPTRPGRVRVVRVDLDYALGWQRLYQRGTDTVAIDITVRAR